MPEMGKEAGNISRINSQWKLREEAARRGYPTSHKQLKGYLRWELITQDADGSFPPEAVDRLVKLRELGEKTRPLSRRAILLHGSYPIPPARLRKAMERTLSLTKAPKRKMKRIDAAARWEARKLEDPAYEGWVRIRPPRHIPDPSEWKAILEREDIDDRLFGDMASVACLLASLVAASTVGTPADVSSIPYEERVVLMTIRQLAGIARQTDKQ